MFIRYDPPRSDVHSQQYLPLFRCFIGSWHTCQTETCTQAPTRTGTGTEAEQITSLYQQYPLDVKLDKMTRRNSPK